MSKTSTKSKLGKDYTYRRLRVPDKIAEQVPDDARYVARIIKNDLGEVTGIYFELTRID